MLLKLEFFLAQLSGPPGFTDPNRISPLNSFDSMSQFAIAIFIVFFIVAIAINSIRKMDYSEKKAAFQQDPNDVVKQEEFIQAARNQASSYEHRGLIDTIATLSASQTPPQQERPQETLASELEKLGQLHSQGILTDEEFAQGKAKLLGH